MKSINKQHLRFVYQNISKNDRNSFNACPVVANIVKVYKKKSAFDILSHADPKSLIKFQQFSLSVMPV